MVKNGSDRPRSVGIAAISLAEFIPVSAQPVFTGRVHYRFCGPEVAWTSRSEEIVPAVVEIENDGFSGSGGVAGTAFDQDKEKPP